MRKYGNTLITVLVALSSLCAAETMPTFQPKLQVGKELSVDKLREQNLNVVQKAVEGIGEHLPQKVDDYTKLIAVDSNGTTLIYTFEVLSGPQSDDTLKRQGKGMAPRIQRGICLSSKRFLQADIDLRYRYISSQSRQEILRVDVDKYRCQDIWNHPNR
jgi:hypothetical protein